MKNLAVPLLVLVAVLSIGVLLSWPSQGNKAAGAKTVQRQEMAQAAAHPRISKVERTP